MGGFLHFNLQVGLSRLTHLWVCLLFALVTLVLMTLWSFLILPLHDSSSPYPSTLSPSCICLHCGVKCAPFSLSDSHKHKDKYKEKEHKHKDHKKDKEREKSKHGNGYALCLCRCMLLQVAVRFTRKGS